MPGLARLERRKRPRGTVLLCGVGRLGFRVFIQLVETHRGGPETIVCVDGQEVEPDDVIHLRHGARVGENKAEFCARLGRAHPDRDVIAVPEYVREEKAESLVEKWRPDVVVIAIAGGRTTPVTARLARAGREAGATTVSTGGVFGYGSEGVRVLSLREASGPVARELRSLGAPEDHLLVTTGRYIRDPDPLAPAVLDRVAHRLVEVTLRSLPGPEERRQREQDRESGRR